MEHALRVVDAAPPVARERPDAEADLRDFQLASTEASVLHCDSFRRSPERAIYCCRSRMAHSVAVCRSPVGPGSSRSAARRPYPTTIGTGRTTQAAISAATEGAT